MGSIDDAVPFFGRNFNRIYPLIMVVYTILVAGNFFGYLFEIFESWKKFKFWTEEEEEMDGFDPSGVFILHKGKNHHVSRRVCFLAIPCTLVFTSCSCGISV